MSATPDSPPPSEPSAKSPSTSEEKAVPGPYAWPTSRGVDLIAAERQRQVEEEGWTPEHDASHDHSEELARAAVCYAMPASWRQSKGWPHGAETAALPREWPWGARFWKPTPTDRLRELVKAGALIAAEIDRLEAMKPLPVSDFADHISPASCYRFINREGVELCARCGTSWPCSLVRVARKYWGQTAPARSSPQSASSAQSAPAAPIHAFAPGPRAICGARGVDIEITTYPERVTCRDCLASSDSASPAPDGAS